MNVDTKIIDGKETIKTKALIDCGAQGTFMDEWFVKKHQLPLLWLKKEIPVSNIDETLNRNGPIKQYTRLPVKIKGNVISTLFYISHLGKENVIFGLPWLGRVNPLINWAEKTLEIDPKRIRKPTKSQTIDQALQVCRVDLERKKMRLKEVFAEELRNLHPRKKSTISIEEIPDEEAIYIVVNELPNQYEDMLALIPDTEDDEEEEEETIEGDLHQS